MCFFSLWKKYVICKFKVKNTSESLWKDHSPKLQKLQEKIQNLSKKFQGKVERKMKKWFQRSKKQEKKEARKEEKVRTKRREFTEFSGMIKMNYNIFLKKWSLNTLWILYFCLLRILIDVVVKVSTQMYFKEIALCEVVSIYLHTKSVKFHGYLFWHSMIYCRIKSLFLLRIVPKQKNWSHIRICS